MVDVLAFYKLYYFTKFFYFYTCHFNIIMAVPMTVSSDDIYDGSSLLINGRLVFSPAIYPLYMKKHVASRINILGPNCVAFLNDRVQVKWQMYITAKIEFVKFIGLYSCKE